MKPYRKYDDLVQEMLQEDPSLLRGYLKDGLRDYQETGEVKILCKVLKRIINAKGGMSRLARKSGIGRENLYSILSGKANFQFISLCRIVDALGLTFNVEKKQPMEEYSKPSIKKA